MKLFKPACIIILILCGRIAPFFRIVDMQNIIKKLKKNTKGGFTGQMIGYCVVGFFVLLVMISFAQSRNTVKEKKAELEAIKAQCEEQKLENEALRELMNNSDDEYIERKAREELDYVLPGERVYIIHSGN